MKHINDANFVTEVKAANLALVDFWAPWCGPCRMLGPILEELDAKIGTKVTIMKMNVDENMVVPNNFGIRGIPTMMLFKNGQHVETVVGLRSAREIEDLVNVHLK